MPSGSRRRDNKGWVIQAIIVMVAAGLGAFFGEHLRTRGKILATKADFESLKDQLRFNTKIVETIKRDVDHKDWAKREWTNLRRVKLEALINAMHDCTAFLPRHRNSSVEGKYHDEQEPMDELDTLASLYLPELKLEVLSFTMACRELVQLQLSMGKDFLTVKRGGPACLNRFSASLSGASAGFRPPCGVAAD